MARARDLEREYVLFGAYPEERTDTVEPALLKAVESHQGRVLARPEARRIWDGRFFPADPEEPIPTPGRAFVQGARLAPTLTQLERKLRGVAIQGTAARMGEVSLLAFDPARGSADLVDLSASTDVRLLRMASRSWRPW